MGTPRKKGTAEAAIPSTAVVRAVVLRGGATKTTRRRCCSAPYQYEYPGGIYLHAGPDAAGNLKKGKQDRWLRFSDAWKTGRAPGREKKNLRRGTGSMSRPGIGRAQLTATWHDRWAHRLDMTADRRRIDGIDRAGGLSVYTGPADGRQNSEYWSRTPARRNRSRCVGGFAGRKKRYFKSAKGVRGTPSRVGRWLIGRWAGFGPTPFIHLIAGQWGRPGRAGQDIGLDDFEIAKARKVPVHAANVRPKAATNYDGRFFSMPADCGA